jgi:hypothetical protein
MRLALSRLNGAARTPPRVPWRTLGGTPRIARSRQFCGGLEGVVQFIETHPYAAQRLLDGLGQLMNDRLSLAFSHRSQRSVMHCKSNLTKREVAAALSRCPMGLLGRRSAGSLRIIAPTSVLQRCLASSSRTLSSATKQLTDVGWPEGLPDRSRRQISPVVCQWDIAWRTSARRIDD